MAYKSGKEVEEEEVKKPRKEKKYIKSQSYKKRYKKSLIKTEKDTFSAILLRILDNFIVLENIFCWITFC